MRIGILNSTISGDTQAEIIPQQLYWLIILKRSSSASPEGNLPSKRKWAPTSICLLNSLDASKAIKINPASIRLCITGRGYSSGGFYWFKKTKQKIQKKIQTPIPI